MRKGLYAIFDNKALDILGSIQLHGHEAAAVRSFKDVVLMQDSPLSKNPEDYALHLLGWLDTETLYTQPAGEGTGDSIQIITAKSILQLAEDNNNART